MMWHYHGCEKFETKMAEGNTMAGSSGTQVGLLTRLGNVSIQLTTVVVFFIELSFSYFSHFSIGTLLFKRKFLFGCLEESEGLIRCDPNELNLHMFNMLNF